MDATWDIAASGPEGAEKTVLLLPGGMVSSRSYAELMAEPALAETRLLAVTLPGNTGAPANTHLCLTTPRFCTPPLLGTLAPCTYSGTCFQNKG